MKELWVKHYEYAKDQGMSDDAAAKYADEESAYSLTAAYDDLDWYERAQIRQQQKEQQCTSK